MRDAIKSNSDRKIMYCPTQLAFNTNKTWNYSTGSETDTLPTDASYTSNYGTIGYVVFIKRPDGSYPSLTAVGRLNPPLDYVTTTMGARDTSITEMLMDPVIGNSATNPTNFPSVTGNAGVPRTSSHMDRALPFANVAYQDAHVDGVKWGDMKKYSVVSSGSLYFYIPGK